jgi:K+-transporting ATPase ATPase C chain
MKLLIQTILIFIFFAILTGLIYPLFITAIAKIAFSRQANGSLVVRGGKVIGSVLIGELFTNDMYFQSRPSAVNYDATNSGADNYGASSSNLIIEVSNNIESVKNSFSLSPGTSIPSDMVMSSASGLDPHISFSNALIQAKSIASARKIPVDAVIKIINEYREIPAPGFSDREIVNVLKLNLALDGISQ